MLCLALVLPSPKGWLRVTIISTAKRYGMTPQMWFCVTIIKWAFVLWQANAVCWSVWHFVSLHVGRQFRATLHKGNRSVMKRPLELPSDRSHFSNIMIHGALMIRNESRNPAIHLKALSWSTVFPSEQRWEGRVKIQESLVSQLHIPALTPNPSLPSSTAGAGNWQSWQTAPFGEEHLWRMPPLIDLWPQTN